MTEQNDPQGRGLPPGGISLIPASSKHVIPPPRVSISSPAKKRLKAFRVPINYAVDAILGYQGNDQKFSVYRIKPGTIPEGFFISFVTFDHARQSAYIVLEHPSFPEYEPGSVCEEITPIELETLAVCEQSSPFLDWCVTHNFDPKDCLVQKLYTQATLN